MLERGARRAALAALGLALALLAGAALSARSCGSTPTPTPPPPPPARAAAAPAAPPEPPPALALTTLAVSGPVERRKPPGGWRSLARGDVLLVDDEIRTGPGASAELQGGAGSRLAVGERTQVDVRDLTLALHRFRLTRGRVELDYEPSGDRVVRVEDSAGGAAAEARGARFHVAANGLTFAVATTTGRVDLSAAGATVSLSQGLQSSASSGHAPSAPRPIPTRILLKVAEASRLGPAGGCLDTIGLSEPGSLVTVDGEPVSVGPDGQFSVRVARHGQASVTLRVTTPDGRSTTRKLPCRGRPEARIDDLKVRWKNGAP